MVELDDDGKLRRRFSNKRVNALAEGYSFELSFEQFCALLTRARVKSSGLGNRGHHLARLGDRGGYVWGNCRFIPYKENVAEKVFSDKQMTALKRNSALAWKSLSPSQRSSQLRKAWRTRRERGTTSPTILSEEVITARAELISDAIIKFDLAVGTWGWLTRLGEVTGLGRVQVSRFVKRYGKRLGIQGIA